MSRYLEGNLMELEQQSVPVSLIEKGSLEKRYRYFECAANLPYSQIAEDLIKYKIFANMQRKSVRVGGKMCYLYPID